MKANRGKTILVIVLSVIVIISVIAGITLSMTSKSEDRQAAADQPGKSIEIDEDEDRLMKDSYPEINDLIKKYREALTSGDVETLKTIYNTEDEINSEVLTSTSKIIEGYSNTACYTKRGLEKNSYFVFIYDDLKISGINEPAPNLTIVYVKSKEDGSYYIDRGEKDPAMGTYSYDMETQKYIEELYRDEEVSELMMSVYEKKEEACKRDAELKKFIEGLSSPDSDVTSESETVSEESGEGETSDQEISEEGGNEISAVE